MTTLPRTLRWTALLFVALLINTGYIWAFADPTVFYMGNVVVHFFLGLALYAAFAWHVLRNPELRAATRISFALLTVSALVGVYLAKFGNTFPNRMFLAAHILTAIAGTIALLPLVFDFARRFEGGWVTYRRAFAGALVFALALPATMALYRRAFPDPRLRIQNPAMPPLAMEQEGGGAKSPFFPSSAQTNVGGIIPSNFFMDSKRCGECHEDIYKQWESSMHHFASFNNQFYRKSIEYMQDVVGTQPSKWCAGCHDHAMFFNGRFETPVKEQIDTPEAHNGLGCMSCHSVVQVESSMGNGGITIEYPPLHELANSDNKYMRKLHDFLTYLDPEPHKKAFLKPFMREDTAEFCSGCHKVHLDVPVNDYRWVRGFNDYDNWQASGVSGQGARSFYYPPKVSNCGTCHMPLVDSQDPGNRDGKVHQHRFLGANTAVPFVNGDHEQLKTAQEFLTNGFITVDIFGVSPIEDTKGEPQMIRRASQGPQLMSSIAVGEEAEQTGQVVMREVGKFAAPFGAAPIRALPGTSVRVEVVVRTRTIGHFFPGGTVDAFDIWLELEGMDATGKKIFWSGQVEDEGRGPVEPGAHFYKAYQLDGAGNPINKRNAWQMRSLLYARMIPPGAADTTHYRIDIPADAKGPITLKAKLNHRKFSHYYTQFAYAGQPKAGQDASLLSKAHNSLEYSFDKANIPANVSGQIKDEIPNLPITVLAESEAKLELGEPAWNPVVRKQDRERWNDWGIGLLLQGDLKAAEYAFKRTTEAEPGYADGWINVARALVREGETDAAKPFLAKAMEINGNLGRAHYFTALVQKADGDYDAALASLQKASALYPRDRVVLNEIARILFLQRKYEEVIGVTRRVCDVDPEDLQAHYTAMLAYRGLGKTKEAEIEAKLFQRFKAEESSQAITAKRRLLSPEDNNERQMIHDHISVALAPVSKPMAPKSTVAGKKPPAAPKRAAARASQSPAPAATGGEE
ncbi:MAG: tetratricopeptide repeat protein [Bryobacteraceae bacterium]